MESHSHYMETFSFLLAIHLSIDFFAISLLLTSIFSLFYPISFYFIIILVYFIIAFFPQYRRMHLMQGNKLVK